MMEIVLAALILGGFAALFGYGIRRRRAARRRALPAAATEPPEPRPLECLRPGDVVLLDDRDFLVSGVALLEHRSASWLEARLEDGGEELWLVVPRDDSPWVLAGRRTQGLALADPPSELLELEQQVYRLLRRGRAEVRSTNGDMGRDFPRRTLRHWEYRQPGAGRIWLRDREGGQGFLAFVGRQVQRPLVSVLPGS
jgi:hypothetical protein